MAAQNFTMPALSPTMTEGNIANWKVKEGDVFSAGDVLLEIETDKASMDVEAQDDGIMAKIILGDGSKQIQVGTRIGVLAESGDDLSILEIPAEENAPKQESKKAEDAPSSARDEASPPPKKQKAPSSTAAKAQTKPLLPSVEHLIHAEGLDMSEVSKMTPTGPNNRLLKGDVLAYIGSIKASYPADLATKINKLSHLDLSNIKLAAPLPAPKKAEAKKPEAPQVSQVKLSISMAEVSKVQSRIQSTLGVFMPLSTFIARATDLANDDLPRSKTAKPSSTELFNDILGLSTVSTPVRGSFMPQISAFPQTALDTVPRAPASRKSDIIDILSGKKEIKKSASAARLPGLAANVNVFSVQVPKGDEKRAKVFLERIKAVLESEPGSLVL